MRRQILSIIVISLLLVLVFTGCATPVAVTDIDEVPTEGGKSSSLTVNRQESVPMGSNVRTVKTDGPTFGMFAKKVVCEDTVWSIGFRSDEEGEVLCALVSVESDAESGRALWLNLPPLPEAAEQALGPGDVLTWECCDIVSTGAAQPQLLLVLEHRLAAEEPDAHGETRRVQWNLGTVDADGTVDPGITLELGEYAEQANVSALLAWQDLVLLSSYSLNAEDPAYLLACSITDGSLRWAIPLPRELYAASAAVTAQQQLVILAKNVLPPQQSTVDTTLLCIDLTQEKPAIGQNFVSTAAVPSSIVAWPYGTQLPEVWLVDQWGIYSWDTVENELCLKYDLSGLPETLYQHMLSPVGLNQEEFLLLYKDSEKTVQAELLSPALYAPAEDRIPVVVAGCEDVVERVARQFNNAQSEIWVDVRDYSNEAAAAAGLTFGAELLQRDLVQGEQIDIIVVPNNFSSGQLDPALFLDLYPLMDTDVELSRSDFVGGVLAACESGGTLPTIVPQYNLLTTVGSAARLGSTPGWSWAEYDALSADATVPLQGFDRTAVLHYMVQMGGKSLLDYDAAVAHLDTPLFVQLLTHTKAYPESTAGYNTQDPKPQLVSGETLALVRFVVGFSHIRTDVYNFDGPIVYKGFPTDDGGTGSAFTAGLRLGISASCTNMEAAWQFMRQFLLPAYQDEIQSGFPLRYDSLQKQAETAQQPLKDPSLPAYFSADALTEKQKEYWMRGITAEEAQQLVGLIEATDTLYLYDDTVFSILAEEADGFYNGVRTAEEAAALIQNRVQTYLAEQG